MKLSEQSDFEKSEMLSIYASNTCYSVIMAGTCTALHQESIPDDWAAWSLVEASYYKFRGVTSPVLCRFPEDFARS